MKNALLIVTTLALVGLVTNAEAKTSFNITLVTATPSHYRAPARTEHIYIPVEAVRSYEPMGRHNDRRDNRKDRRDYRDTRRDERRDCAQPRIIYVQPPYPYYTVPMGYSEIKVVYFIHGEKNIVIFPRSAWENEGWGAWQHGHRW